MQISGFATLSPNEAVAVLCATLGDPNEYGVLDIDKRSLYPRKELSGERLNAMASAVAQILASEYEQELLASLGYEQLAREQYFQHALEYPHSILISQDWQAGNCLSGSHCSNC